jgi:hypothetical protein
LSLDSGTREDSGLLPFHFIYLFIYFGGSGGMRTFLSILNFFPLLFHPSLAPLFFLSSQLIPPVFSEASLRLVFPQAGLYHHDGLESAGGGIELVWLLPWKRRVEEEARKCWPDKGASVQEICHEQQMDQCLQQR